MPVVCFALCNQPGWAVPNSTMCRWSISVKSWQKGDAAVAWNVTNLGTHHWMLGMFEQAAQDRVWDHDPDALIASSFVFPAGQARRTNGGYIIKGRWPFSSGVDSSGWNMLGAIVSRPENDTQAPELRIFLLPDSEYTIIDTLAYSRIERDRIQGCRSC